MTSMTTASAPSLRRSPPKARYTSSTIAPLSNAAHGTRRRQAPHYHRDLIVRPRWTVRAIAPALSRRASGPGRQSCKDRFAAVRAHARGGLRQGYGKVSTARLQQGGRGRRCPRERVFSWTSRVHKRRRVCTRKHGKVTVRHRSMEIIRITCGARTRAGHPCRRNGTGKGQRCRNHGGRSTGPRTIEGRERIASAQRDRWKHWRVNNARVLPELSRKQELRHIRTFEALTASGMQASKLMNPQYAPRLARRAQREAENRFAIDLMRNNPPPRRQQSSHMPNRYERMCSRWRKKSP